MDLSRYLKEERIPITERFADAFSILFTYICQGILNILNAPVMFIKTFFRSSRPVIDIKTLLMDNQHLFNIDNTIPPLPPPLPPPPSPPDDDWKRRHDELYGGND